MSTLRHRTITREDFEWSINVMEVRRHGTVAKEAMLKRAGEIWATVQLMHTGAVKVQKIWPSNTIPDSVLTEVKKDLGVLNV